MLPQLDKPRILDVGCGSGVPTMELARLSNGEVIGLDTNQDLLDELVRKIERAGVSERVKAMRCSMLDMEFPDESFDIIWAEGSIQFIGFKQGLQNWRRFLKPNGFIAVHDEKGNINEKLEQIPIYGYKLLGYFVLNEDSWWAEYFAPLEKLIYETRAKYSNDAFWKWPIGFPVFRQERFQNLLGCWICRLQKRARWHGLAYRRDWHCNEFRLVLDEKKERVNKTVLQLQDNEKRLIASSQRPERKAARRASCRRLEGSRRTAPPR